MERHALTDAQWERLRPPPPAGRGRPRRDDRTVVEGIRWRLATGVPWRDLPAHFGPWRTVYFRFRRRQRAGVWAGALAALQATGDAEGALDWSQHVVDGTTVRAHQHAAGARKGEATRPLAARGTAARPSSTSAPRAAASRSPSS